MDAQQKKNGQMISLLAGILLLAALTALCLFWVNYQTIDGQNGATGQNGLDASGSLPWQNEPALPANAAASSKDSWELLLVNGTNPLPEGFEATLTTMPDGGSFDSRAYPALKRMLDDARAAGFSPIVCSAYRTQKKQETLYQNKVNFYTAQSYPLEEAKLMAAHWVAPPGTSEHQTGLAADIVDESYQMLDEKQEETPVQKWLIKNCWRYGFILRYPTDRSDITGIGYEPWHYRYVGQEAARDITERGICLEEYLGAV